MSEPVNPSSPVIESTYDFNFDPEAQSNFDVLSPLDRTLFIFEAVKTLKRIFDLALRRPGFLQNTGQIWLLADNLDFCFGSRQKLIEAPPGYIPPIYAYVFITSPDDFVNNIVMANR